MSAHHPHTFDPRTVSPLACCDSAGDLSTHPKDSLHRVAITLELLSDLIGNGKGESDFLAYEDSRFALSLQLSGMAQVLEAVGDAIQIRKPSMRGNEVIAEFSTEELNKLTIIAARKQTSIQDAIQGIVIDALTAFVPDRRN